MDYIITRRCGLKDFCSTRALRGAECSTDHFMIRSKCHIKPKPPPMKKKGSKPPKKLHVKKLKEQSVKDQLVTAINENLQTLPTGTSEEQWRSLKNAVYSAASDVLGKPTRKHADWFDESNEEIMELVNKKNSLFHRTLGCYNQLMFCAPKVWTGGCTQEQIRVWLPLCIQADSRCFENLSHPATM